MSYEIKKIVVFQILYQGAGFSPSQRTVQDPSSGNPGACFAGAPSQPAAIIATA